MLGLAAPQTEVLCSSTEQVQHGQDLPTHPQPWSGGTTSRGGRVIQLLRPFHSLESLLRRLTKVTTAVKFFLKKKMETQLGTRWTFPAHNWKTYEQQSVILGLLFLFQIQKAHPGIWSAPERCRENFAEWQTVSGTRLCARGEAETDCGLRGRPGPPGPAPTSHRIRAHQTVNEIILHTLPQGWWWTALTWSCLGSALSALPF